MLNREYLKQIKTDFAKAQQDMELFNYNKVNLRKGLSAKVRVILMVLVLFLFCMSYVSDIFILFVGVVVIILTIGLTVANEIDVSENKEIDNFVKLVSVHNTNVFYLKCENDINEIENVSKIICCKKNKRVYENIVICDEINEITYIEGIFNCFNNTVQINKNRCLYKDILKYELIDETTSQLIASSSVINSNVGKSIVGAVATSMLLSNATVGAVIGASGQQTTQTKYKTQTKESYILNIFVNRLNDSIIKIKTPNRQVISEIISVIEYIINKNG